MPERETTATAESRGRRRGGWLDGARATSRLRRPRLETHLFSGPPPAPDGRDAAIAELRAEIATARARIRALETELVARTTHLLFIGTPRGYELRAADGPPPAVGSRLDAADGTGRELAVTKVGPSPLPHDRRRCAFVQAV